MTILIPITNITASLELEAADPIPTGTLAGVAEVLILPIPLTEGDEFEVHNGYLAEDPRLREP